MKASWYVVLLVSFLCWCLLIPQVSWCETTQQSLEPLRLESAIQGALGNNAAIKNHLLEIGIAKDRVAAARTHFLPTVRFSALGLQLLTPLNFGFDRGALGSFPATGPIPGENINVTTAPKPALFLNAFVAQPILQLARLRLGVKEGELAQTIAMQRLRVQQQQVINQVKRAYYRALQLEDTINVIDATINLYREIDRLTNEYIAQKTVLKSDSLEVKQQLANSEYDQLKLKNSLACQKEEINHLLGRDVLSSFSLLSVGAPPSSNIDLTTAQKRALACRAEIQQVSTQTQQLDLERRMKRLEYLPEFSLVADYLSVFGTEVLPKNLVFAGLLFNWEPCDWGRRSHEYREKQELLQQSKNTLHDLEAQITCEVNASVRNMQECAKRLEVTQLGQQLAAERLRVLTNRYREHSALLKDVLQGQRDLTQADNQYTQSVLALWTARADLEKSMGEE